MEQAFRYRIDSEIIIEATPDQVWKVFGDFGNWGEWNDFMVLRKVPEKVGQHCQVLFHLDGGCLKTSIHDPEILVLEENKELRWRDYRGPLVSQFFRGSHWWVLEPLPNGHTRFLHGAEMFGLALPFLQPTMRATRHGYHVWNKALRQEVLARMQQQDKLKASAAAHNGLADTQQQKDTAPEAKSAQKGAAKQLHGAAVSVVAKVQRKPSKTQPGPALDTDTQLDAAGRAGELDAASKA